MMRLIDADALEFHMNERLSWLVKGCGRHDHYTSGYGDGLCAVEDAPTIDAVEVVRCKDCEYWNTEERSYFGTKCRCERFSLVGYSENYVLPNDFCSYGERRDEDA